MDLHHPRLNDYLDGLVVPRHPVLGEMEARAARTGFPIVGPQVGSLFYLLARALGARTIFEMGSGFGYSTAWFATALRDGGGGEVHQVVWDDALSKEARESLDRMGLTPYVRFHVGEAVAALRARAESFDVIFCDIDKDAYPAALPVMRERLRPGGLLIVDNMLWGGRVFEPQNADTRTRGVLDLTQALFADPAFAATLLPLRDGVAVAWKRR